MFPAFPADLLCGFSVMAAGMPPKKYRFIASKPPPFVIALLAFAAR